MFLSPANAASVPIIFVIDAALDSTDLTAATEITLETSSQLTDETAFSIVIYDDVVQKVVPLGTMGTERLALIKRTLDDTVSMPTSNLAAGIERAQDELNELSTGHIILFTTAQITTETNDKRAQYLEWYKNVLLPDIAEKKLSLTFVTQAKAESNPLVKLAESYQNTSFIPLQPGSLATQKLISLLNEPSAKPTQTAAQVSDAALPHSQTSDSSDQQIAQTDTKSVETTKPLAVQSDVLDTNVEDTKDVKPASENQDNSTITTQTEPGLIWDRQLLHIIWYVCVALVLLALIAWLIWINLKRKASVEQTAQTQTNPTGSAYLPLNEMPSRRFDALADAIDDLEPYKQWTAEARTARQLDAEPLAQHKSASQGTDDPAIKKPGNNSPSPPHDVAPKRVPNVFKPKN